MKDEDCIFCKIAAGDIPSATLYEDEYFRVILDLGPATKGHALIIPKDHYKDVTTLPEDLAGRVLPLSAKIGDALVKSLGADGFNLVQNNGEAAGQTVMHFHMHVIPRYKDDTGMILWTPGSTDQAYMQDIVGKVRTFFAENA